MSARIYHFPNSMGGPPWGGEGISGTPSLFVEESVVLDLAGDALRRWTETFHRQLWGRLEQWSWVKLERFTPSLARYRLALTVCRNTTDDIVVHVLLQAGQKFFERDIVARLRASGSLPPSVCGRSALALVFACVTQQIFAWEEDSGIQARWESADARQCMMWAYVLWTRLTPADNLRARQLAHDALCCAGAELLKPRILAILAETYVEGLAYGWDDMLHAKLKLKEHASEAWHADSKDPVALTAYSNFLSYNDASHLALLRLENGLEEEAVCPLPLNFFGLQSSYRGDFATVERYLGALVHDEGNDRVHAFGLQYLAQYKFFCGEYDAGVVAAKAALKRNPRSLPAMRAVAANLVACGSIQDARGYIIEANRNSSQVFKTKNYAAQPWRDRRGIERYAEALNEAGVPKR